WDSGTVNFVPTHLNAYGNFVTVDSITEQDCGPMSSFALKMSVTYAQSWFRNPWSYWQRWNDVLFVDPQHGIVVGDHGSVLRTTDGGTSWTADTIGLNLPFHQLAAPVPTSVFAAGEYGALFHSTDL